MRRIENQLRLALEARPQESAQIAELGQKLQSLLVLFDQWTRQERASHETYRRDLDKLLIAAGVVKTESENESPPPVVTPSMESQTVSIPEKEEVWLVFDKCWVSQFQKAYTAIGGLMPPAFLLLQEHNLPVKAFEYGDDSLEPVTLDWLRAKANRAYVTPDTCFREWSGISDRLFHVSDKRIHVILVSFQARIKHFNVSKIEPTLKAIRDQKVCPSWFLYDPSGIDYDLTYGETANRRFAGRGQMVIWKHWRDREAFGQLAKGFFSNVAKTIKGAIGKPTCGWE